MRAARRPSPPDARCSEATTARLSPRQDECFAETVGTLTGWAARSLPLASEGEAAVELNTCAWEPVFDSVPQKCLSGELVELKTLRRGGSCLQVEEAAAEDATPTHAQRRELLQRRDVQLQSPACSSSARVMSALPPRAPRVEESPARRRAESPNLFRKPPRQRAQSADARRAPVDPPRKAPGSQPPSRCGSRGPEAGRRSSSAPRREVRSASRTRSAVQSNRKLIRNALERHCLKGEANREQRQQLLEPFDTELADYDRFVILFRSLHTGRHDFRALYGYRPADRGGGGTWVRVLQTHPSPPLLEEGMVALSLRYNCGSKEFKEVPKVQELVNVVDAVFVKPEYLPRPRAAP